MKSGSFFSRLYWRFFKWHFNWEIFERILCHLRGDNNYGYPFHTDEQMVAHTEMLEMHKLLGRVEGHIRNMPDAYRKAFRYSMHRDLHERLRVYEQLAKRYVRRPCDPRLVAERLEPA